MNETDTGGYYYLWGEDGLVDEVYDETLDTYTQVNNYTYTVELLPDRRGFYYLHTYVCELDENACGSRDSDLESYSDMSLSPQMIYLTTEFVSPSRTKSTGIGLHTSIVSRVEKFLISLFD